jgi:O-antigen ligase
VNFIMPDCGEKIMLKNGNNNNYFKINFSVCAMFVMIFSQVLNTAKCGTGIGDIEISYIVAMLLTLLQLMNQKRLQIDFTDILLVSLWMIIAIISTLVSNVVKWNVNGYSLLACMLFYILVTNTSIKSRDMHILFRVYSVIVFLISLLILYMHYNSSLSVYGDRYTITILGVSKDPNFLSAFMVPCFIYTCYSYIFNPNVSKLRGYLLSPLLFIVFIAIFYTGSRAAMLSIVATMLLIFISKMFSGKKDKIGTIFIFVVLMIALATVVNILLIGSPLYERMFSIDSYSSNIRLLIWHDAIKAFLNNPIIGEGHLSGSYYVSLGIKGKWFGTHNCFLDIITGTGILGGIILLSIFKSMMDVKEENKVFLLSFIVSSFIPLFFINGYDSMSFWLPMILCKMISNCCKNKIYYELL